MNDFTQLSFILSIVLINIFIVYLCFEGWLSDLDFEIQKKKFELFKLIINPNRGTG